MICADCEKEIIGTVHDVNGQLICTGCFIAGEYDQLAGYEKIRRSNESGHVNEY